MLQLRVHTNHHQPSHVPLTVLTALQSPKDARQTAQRIHSLILMRALTCSAACFSCTMLLCCTLSRVYLYREREVSPMEMIYRSDCPQC